ncbi:MAG: PQQ-binding-like beta-propeller repeat protein [Planctomycetaceae bacterium]|nr:PQQ-binding-like beta-propeller repeat protein [Planctomycetaceae bacterium]
MLRVLISLICLQCSLIPVSAEDWPFWRGLHRNDHVATHSGWSGDRWPLTEEWQIEVGEGSTTPIVADGQVITMGYADEKETVVALDIETGKTLWKQSYPAPRYGRYAVGDKGLYFGPTASPEYDPETKLVFTLGCDGELACWNAAEQGREVWRKNLYEIYQMEQRPGEGERNRNQRDYGYITAPRIYKNWLLVETGGKAGTICAFDKQTGRQVWASEHQGFAGHSGGLVVMNVEGVPCQASLSFQEFLVMRLDPGHEGETVGVYEWPSAYANNLLTPTVLDDTAFLSSWHSFGEKNNPTTHRVRVTLKGIEKLWEQPVSSHLCSPVVKADRIYIAGPELRCLDLNTGTTIWKGAGFDYGASCVLTKDDRLIVLGNRGKLRLIDTAGHRQSDYTELALRNTLTKDDLWSHVVVARDRILCKDVRGRLQCLKIGR